MTVELWQLVVAACTAVGVAALAVRSLVRMISHAQVRRLTREGEALQRWWQVLAEVPADVLTPPLRRILGRIMYRRLEAAARLNPGHPFLRAQREEMSRFIAGGNPAGPTRTARHRSDPEARPRQLAALRRLLEMLETSGRERLVSTPERVSAEAAVSRALTELEFLEAQQTRLAADSLRRLTRAIGGAAPPLWGPQSSRAFPTQ